jgi:hypothetical protein
MSKDPIPIERAKAQMRALYANENKSGSGDEVEYEGGTHRENFFKTHNLSPSTKPSLAGVAKISGVPKSILQQVYNRGIGAYSSSPKSVRLKGSFVKNVDAPMKKKLSKEQWAWARVYSFLDGNPKHDNDLRANKKKTGKGSCCDDCENAGGTMCGGSNPAQPRLSGGVPHQSTLHKMALASYNPELTGDIDGFELIEKHPTIRFYGKENEIVVAIRGTQGSLVDEDWRANYTLATGYIRSTDRFKKDLKIIEAFQKEYPKDEYKYYGVAHSLGGALLDQFIDLGFIRQGVSYNPAVNVSDLGKHLPVKRIYIDKDPLYNIFGRLLTDAPEVRKGEPDSLWLQLGKWAGGVTGLASHISSYLKNHKISDPVFEGGSTLAVSNWVRKFGLTPEAYLKEARLRAKAHGYPYKLLGFADDGVHKLAIPNHEGKIIRFGRVGNGDHILYSHTDKALAEKKKNVFHKSHSKIKGDWKSNPFSPNNLALRILW